MTSLYNKAAAFVTGGTGKAAVMAKNDDDVVIVYAKRTAMTKVSTTSNYLTSFPALYLSRRDV
jgi:ABC-type tungstate transport system permease subunit